MDREGYHLLTNLIDNELAWLESQIRSLWDYLLFLHWPWEIDSVLVERVGGWVGVTCKVTAHGQVCSWLCILVYH